MPGRGASGRIGALRPAVLVGSAILHAALFVLLARYLAQTAEYGEAPAIQVSLVPTPLRPDRADREVAEAAPPDQRDRLARAEPALPTRPAPPAPDGAVAPRVSSDAAPGGAEAAGVRQALRGLRGCERAQLTRDERERCEAQRWVGAAPVTARLNLDPSGRYAENPDPFLSRRPTKGCRLRATGDVDPMGDDSHARAGITCVKPF